MTPGISIDAKIEWLNSFCSLYGLNLELDGEIGFGRDCVGILNPVGNEYVVYAYSQNLGPTDSEPNAYHKSNCIAILGKGPYSIDQLYSWMKRLSDKNVKFVEVKKEIPDLGSLFGQTTEWMVVQ